MLMNGEFAIQFTIPEWNLVTIKCSSVAMVD